MQNYQKLNNGHGLLLQFANKRCFEVEIKKNNRQRPTTN